MVLDKVNPALYTLISNIAENKGISKNKLLRPILREIVNEFSLLDQKKVSGKDMKIHVRGSAADVEKDLREFCKILGVHYTPVVKLKLLEKLSKFPEQLKQPPLKY